MRLFGILLCQNQFLGEFGLRGLQIWEEISLIRSYFVPVLRVQLREELLDAALGAEERRAPVALRLQLLVRYSPREAEPPGALEEIPVADEPRPLWKDSHV